MPYQKLEYHLQPRFDTYTDDNKSLSKSNG